MLRYYHGALALGRFPFSAYNRMMASFMGTTGLAVDAWHKTVAKLQNRAASIQAQTPHQPSRAQNVWTAHHGIVFGGTSQGSIPHAPTVNSRSSSTISAVKSEHATNPELDMKEVASTTKAVEPTTTTHVEPADSTAETQKKPEVPRMTSKYKMSEDAFKAALSAEPGDPGSYWSHTMFVGPEQKGITVHYCKSKHTTERIAQMFLKEKVLGFDIEWQPDSLKYQGPKANVSLIQLASEERVALFHIAVYARNSIDDLVAPTLKKIMEDPEITKCGVAIKADATRLRNFLHIDLKGLMELSHLHKLVKYSASGEVNFINKKLVSLAGQVEEHMHLPLFKGQDVRSSDWAQPLNMDQILYAASDTYAGLVLYDVLEVKRQELDPTPPRPYHAELNKPIRLAKGSIDVEETEELEPVQEDSVKGSRPRSTRILSEDRLREAQKHVSVEADGDEGSNRESFANSKAASKAGKVTGKDSKLKGNPLVEAAELWASGYKASHPNTKAFKAQLRAYALWSQNPELRPEHIGALLRDPPLLKTTVQNYILAAIALENLAFDKSRMEDWPPEIVGLRRYAAIWAREKRKEEHANLEGSK